MVSMRPKFFRMNEKSYREIDRKSLIKYKLDSNSIRQAVDFCSAFDTESRRPGQRPDPTFVRQICRTKSRAKRTFNIPYIPKKSLFTYVKQLCTNIKYPTSDIYIFIIHMRKIKLFYSGIWYTKTNYLD